MFDFVNRKLASGTVFTSEVQLQKYLNSLRGYLTRKSLLPKNWKAQQGRILARFRRGQLVAPATTANAD